MAAIRGQRHVIYPAMPPRVAKPARRDDVSGLICSTVAKRMEMLRGALL
jgi:hypothetical protein